MHVNPSFACLLMFMVSVALAQQSSSGESDRDRARLRGPVKTVVDEQTFSGADGQKFLLSTTTEYAPDGRILNERTRNTDASEQVVSYTYESDGRLLKVVTNSTGSSDRSETTYLYDEARRLVAVKSGNEIQMRYQYDDSGRKSAIETFDSKPLPANTAYAPHWEGTDLGFAPSPGGKVTTAYNEQGVATGAQFYDAKGNLVGHIARKFDSEGRVVAEEQVADGPQLDLPEEMLSHLNPEQLKSVGLMMSGMQNSVISYSYDPQGHVTERHRSGGVFGEQVTATKYNDRGDKASELQTIVMRSDTGPWKLTEAGAFVPSGTPNPPQKPQTSETRYSYQYDQYGNWTEQTILTRVPPDETFRPGTIIHRKLTYY